MGLSASNYVEGKIVRIHGLKKDGTDGKVRFQLLGDEAPDQETPEKDLLRKLDGDFLGITFRDAPRKDASGTEQPRRVFDIQLKDGGETFLLQSGFTQMGRTLLNSLISRDQIGRVMISIYTNKKGYPSISVYSKDQGTTDQPLQWKYSPEELKALVIVTPLPDGKNHYSYKKVDELLEKDASMLTSIDNDKGELNFDRDVEELTKPVTPKLDKKTTMEDVMDEDLPF